MKNIVICFSGSRLDEDPLDELEYRMAYGELADAVARRGHALFIVRHTVSYLGGARFADGWKWNGDRFAEWKEEIRADRIFNKSLDFVPDAPVDMVNPLQIQAPCRNKVMLPRRLPSLCPVTRVVRDETELGAAFADIPSRLVVVKPFEGSGGEGVFIGTRGEVMSSLPAYPFLAQEWIDTAEGIPGLVDTFHDFRLMIMNGKLILTFLRCPRRGSLISNVSRGGWVVPVPPAWRPSEPLELIAPVDAMFAHLPRRFYTIDCVRGRDGQWKIIELNDQPGLMPRKQIGDEVEGYLDALCELLLD